MIVDNIRRLADSRGLSINRLESAVGLSSGTINKWDTNIPSVVRVKAVADFFGVTVDELLKNDGDEPLSTDADGGAEE